MKKTVLKAAAGFLAVPLLIFGATAVVGDTHTVAAKGGGVRAGLDATGQRGAAGGKDVGQIVASVVNAMLYIIGAASVIMLIYGGIRYTTSGGNSSSVTAAKNTIIYAVVGLLVAILAYAIVNWVLDLGGNL